MGVQKSTSKYALALRNEMNPNNKVVVADPKTTLSQTDLVVLQRHLEGWTVRRIAKELGHTIQNIYKILNKPECVEIVTKNRDLVYDELQALGDKVVSVLRKGLDSDNENTQIKCALGLVGKLAKPKNAESLDDKMTTSKFLQQININTLQVLNPTDNKEEGQENVKVIDHAADNTRDS